MISTIDLAFHNLAYHPKA